MRILPILASIVLAALVSECKQRNASSLSIKRGLEDLLKIEEFPFEEQVNICSKNYFVLLGASGEGLGKVYVAEGAKSYFSTRDLEDWHRYEESKENDYWTVLQEQKQKMVAKLSSAKNSCSRVLSKVDQATKNPGNYYLATVLDGPKMNDSSIESWHFSLDDYGDINLNTRFSFAYQRGTLSSRQNDFEILLGRDLTKVVGQLFNHFQALLGQRTIDQTIYFFKSHGAEFRKRSPLDLPILEFLSYEILPVNDSVMFFDSHDENGLVKNNQFFIPIWSSEFICTRFFKATSKEFRHCVAQLKTQSPTDERTQSAGQPESVFSAFKGQMLDHSFWEKGTQGITIGTGLYGGPEFQNKTFALDSRIQFPLTKDNLVYSTISKNNKKLTLPMAYRLMGTGITLNDESNAPEFRLRLPSGKTDPSFIVFDTCSSKAAHSATATQQKTVTWQPDNQIGAVILSNPMPLYITALDYSLLDIAQYWMLTNRLWPVTKESLVDKNTNENTLKILKILLTDPKSIDSTDERVYSRIQTTSVNCVNKENDACTEHSPFSLFMAEYRYRLALEDLKQFFINSEKSEGDSKYYAFHILMGRLFELDWGLLFGKNLESRFESEMVERLFSDLNSKVKNAFEKHGDTLGGIAALGEVLSNPGGFLGKMILSILYPIQKLQGHVFRSKMLNHSFRFLLTAYMEVARTYVDEILEVQNQSDSIQSFAKSYTTDSMKDLIVLDMYYSYIYIDLIRQIKEQLANIVTDISSIESTINEHKKFIELSANVLGILENTHTVLKTAGLESKYDMGIVTFKGKDEKPTEKVQVDHSALQKSVNNYVNSEVFAKRYPNLAPLMRKRAPEKMDNVNLLDLF